MSELFQGRPYVVSSRVEGESLDEVFLWADEMDIDCLCQGIMQGTPADPDDEEWCSVWSFGNEEERTMFILRFGS